MDFDIPIASFIDNDDLGYRTLATPPFCTHDATEKSFNFSDDCKFDFLDDSIEQFHGTEIFGDDNTPIIEMTNIHSSLSTINFKDEFNSKDNHEPSTLYRSESCPESGACQTSYTSDNEESFDLEDFMINDVSTGKMRSPKLYEFLRLLLDNDRYISYASWLNKRKGIFKIHKPVQVANLWKMVKVRKTTGSLDYDTFARSIRYYYKPGIMVKTHTRHTYRFAHV